jgi:hypothetical protein
MEAAAAIHSILGVGTADNAVPICPDFLFDAVDIVLGLYPPAPAYDVCTSPDWVFLSAAHAADPCLMG